MSKKIAITGGIGSGKSTVSSILKDKGYPVYSCDEIYAELVNSKIYINEIEKAFPSAIKQGEIDKKSLAEIIFSNRQERMRLNKIAHPLVMQTLLKQMNDDENPIIFAEVPLLLEGNFENLFDQTIVVLRDREERIHSICDRDGISPEKAIERINAQFDYDDIKSKNRLQKIGAIFIKNKGDFSALENSVNVALKKLNVKHCL